MGLSDKTVAWRSKNFSAFSQHSFGRVVKTAFICPGEHFWGKQSFSRTSSHLLVCSVFWATICCTHVRKIQQNCHNWIVYAQRNVLRKIVFFENFIFFFVSFGLSKSWDCTFEKIFWSFGDNFLAGLSKLNSLCPGHHFEINSFSSNFFSFFKILGLLAEPS